MGRSPWTVGEATSLLEGIHHELEHTDIVVC